VNIYSNFNLSLSRTVISFLMLVVALAAQATWDRLRCGNEELFQLGYILLPVSSSIYVGQKAKNGERGDRVCFKVILRHSTKRPMKTRGNLN
jgi:hypothetical protein